MRSSEKWESESSHEKTRSYRCPKSEAQRKKSLLLPSVNLYQGKRRQTERVEYLERARTQSVLIVLKMRVIEIAEVRRTHSAVEEFCGRAASCFYIIGYLLDTVLG